MTAMKPYGATVAGSRRSPGPRPGTSGPAEGNPTVRLGSRLDLAEAARVAPLLRAARDLELWAGPCDGPVGGDLDPAAAAAAAAALDLQPREAAAAWPVVLATRQLEVPGPDGPALGLGAVLASGGPDAVLAAWDAALAAVLDSEELDGIATALYTVGGPVGMDGLFDAYASAAGTTRQGCTPADGDGADHGADHGAALSQALETLADLGVVELGTDEADGSLTVALSPLGTWGLHRRLRAAGWLVPAVGMTAHQDAAALLAALASCDAEDGEIEISLWLAERQPMAAAAELIDAAAAGTPGIRGAAFAVLDRIGAPAAAQVRAALQRPMLRAHAAVWLLEHGEDVALAPEDRAWLLVDLGTGLLEEASPADVAAELLPDLPPVDQAAIVAGLWQVSHPGVTSLLTALSDHHPDPGVARAARKAAFKARSPAAADHPAS